MNNVHHNIHVMNQPEEKHLSSIKGALGL